MDDIVGTLSNSPHNRGDEMTWGPAEADAITADFGGWHVPEEPAEWK